MSEFPVWKIIMLISALLFAGICVLIWIWNVWRAKQMRKTDYDQNSKKPLKYKLPIKLDKLIFILGGIENVVSASSSNNKLKVIINDNKKVDLNALKKIKHRGIFEQSNSISIVIGSSAIFLSTRINELLEHNKNK